MPFKYVPVAVDRFIVFSWLQKRRVQKKLRVLCTIIFSCNSDVGLY